MSEKLEISFNSPQCGWMSVGFSAGAKEFHTTTAHAPHEEALAELLGILSNLFGADDFEKTLKWNRDPEAYDFVFHKNGSRTQLEIIEYPTEDRETRTAEKVFSYEGGTREISKAFYETFRQLYAEREADEFEQNWRQPFPLDEFQNFENKIKNQGQ
ncbi:MAG: hypothetical protein R2747_11070 [Pyrinomonadaceae bacterium]